MTNNNFFSSGTLWRNCSSQRGKKSNVLQQNMKEKERIEPEKQKAKQEREKVICAHKEVYNLQHQASEKQTKRQKEEERELRNWEMIQRFRRAEFDKQNNWEENKRRWQQKLEYRDELQKDIIRIYFSDSCLHKRKIY